jgi:SAM-dependent methyltransferase
MISEATLRRWYPNYRDEDWFLSETVRRCLENARTILDAGCARGEGNPLRLRHPSRVVVGLDIDLGVAENQFVDVKVLGSLSSIPFKDDLFHLVVLRYVVEQLEDPDGVFTELRRVLAPGGRVVILTPNVFHYVSLVARLTPHRFHVWVNKKRGREACNTFPTFYKANTLRQLVKKMANAGLHLEGATMFESRPNYLLFTRLLFLLGVAYERVVNRWGLLAPLRVNIIAVFQKALRAGTLPVPVSGGGGIRGPQSAVST